MRALLRPYPVLMAVSAIVSIGALSLLKWHEQDISAVVDNGTGLHSQAIWSYMLIQSIEVTKIVGYLLGISLWFSYWGLRRSVPTKAGFMVGLRCMIAVVSLGLLGLFAGELFLITVFLGYETMATLGVSGIASYQKENSLVMHVTALADAVYPLGSFLLWAVREEGHSVLD